VKFREKKREFSSPFSFSGGVAIATGTAMRCNSGHVKIYVLISSLIAWLQSTSIQKHLKIETRDLQNASEVTSVFHRQFNDLKMLLRED